MSCLLSINGTRVADTGAEASAGLPVALTGLKVAWGRDSTESQPDPSTCAFDVQQRPALDTDVADLLVPGATVDVHAAGLYTIDNGTNVVDSPWMNWPADAAPTATPHDHVYPIGGATAQQTTIPAELAYWLYGNGVAVDITVANGNQGCVFLPRPLNSSRWSEIPRVEESGPLRYTVSVLAPLGARMCARACAFNPTTKVVAIGQAGPTVIASGNDWVKLEVTANLSTPGYPCVGFQVLTPVATQTWATASGTWAAQTGAW